MRGSLEKHWLRGRGVLGGWRGLVREFKAITYQSFGTQGAQPYRPVICGK